MGPGKADLLAAIDTTGSIAGAGRALGMSYQKTRHLLDQMNQCFKAPVAEAFKGGAQGGGARLTELGREALARYRGMEDRAAASVAEDLHAFETLLIKRTRG